MISQSLKGLYEKFCFHYFVDQWVVEKDIIINTDTVYHWWPGSRSSYAIVIGTEKGKLQGLNCGRSVDKQMRLKGWTSV